MRITCPICQEVILDAPDDFAHRPFCSKRCKLVDLHNWMNEVYRVPDDDGVGPDTDPSVN